jgi:small-conductance mechanosensitive channel
MDNLTANNITSFINLLNFEKIFALVFSLFLLGAFVRITKVFSDFFGETFPNRRILISQFQAVFAYFLYVVGGVYLVFSIISPTKEIILAIGGSAAVAIGFSLKDLVASIVAGVILIFDRPFQVGDRVQFGDHYGDITSIGLRAVRLQTLDDSTITIPNSKFITDTVTSANMGSLDMQVEVYFHLPIQSDFEKVKNILYEVASSSRFVYLKKNVIINSIEMITENQTIMKYIVKAYIIDTHFESAFKTDITNRSNELLLRANLR